MTDDQRISFLNDLREVMRKHGVGSLTAYASICYVYAPGGNGIAAFREIMIEGPNCQLMGYKL